MCLKIILSLAVLLGSISKVSSAKEVYVLGMEQKDSFGIFKLPAIFLGIEKINELYNETFHVNLLRAKSSFGPSCNPNGKAVSFSEIYYDQKLDASLGPGCTPSVEPVARMCTSWNILIMITVGTDVIFDDQEDFPTLVRTSVSVSKFGYFYIEFFQHFSWKDIALVYDHDATSCSRWREGLEPMLATSGYQVTAVKMRSLATGLLEHTQTLLEASQVSRVFAFCCHMDDFRRLMIIAHGLGMTNGEYIFLICTRYNGDFFSNPHWYRGDEYDNVARDAWESVMLVKYRKDYTAEYQQVEQVIRARALAEFNYTYDPEPTVETMMYYELALIYGQVLNETIVSGGNYSDGVYMRSQIANRSFHGINGQIFFDSIGSYEPDYALYDMDTTSGNFQVVGDYFGYLKTITMNNVSIQWPNNYGPPPNIPLCGFTNENPACIPKTLNVLAIVSGSLLGLIVIVMAIGLFGYRRMKREAELNSQWWRIKSGEVLFNDKRVNSLGSRKSRLSMLKSVEDLSSTKESTAQNPEHCGIYQGVVVFLKKTKLTNLNLNRANLVELQRIRDMPCANLIKFMGLYQDEKDIYRVTEYCSRGSLQDIVHNDSINLDWDFKAALLTDLTNGMDFLHESLISVHGRLNSERCVIDSRFVLKITGFGVTFLHGTDPLKNIENINEQLWFAPEVLRQKCKVSQSADVYSFAMIMFEILARMSPFEMDLDLLTVEEIVNNIKNGGPNKSFRPQLPGDIEHLKAIGLMKDCWDESIFKRPTFRAIKKTMRSITGISKSQNIMDSLLRRMEQYANNLEDLVGQRTEAFLEEKKKSEALLDQVLPRSVAMKLKNGLPVEPEAFQCVTIYFSDIVGFTTLSANSSPIQVVDLLNSLYTMFDAIIDTYDVYKVETIGDAYMVVSGLPARNGDQHVKEIALMSLSILRDIRKFRIHHLPNTQLQARIGMHSGSVCAGVVGRKMPRYCLFGDTVNTASRMESHGQAMKIHVSPAANSLLMKFPDFEMEPRGKIPIKGKGEMETFWLLETSMPLPDKMASSETEILVDNKNATNLTLTNSSFLNENAVNELIDIASIRSLVLSETEKNTTSIPHNRGSIYKINGDSNENDV